MERSAAAETATHAFARQAELVAENLAEAACGIVAPCVSQSQVCVPRAGIDDDEAEDREADDGAAAATGRDVAVLLAALLPALALALALAVAAAPIFHTPPLASTYGMGSPGSVALATAAFLAATAFWRLTAAATTLQGKRNSP